MSKVVRVRIYKNIFIEYACLMSGGKYIIHIQDDMI